MAFPLRFKLKHKDTGQSFKEWAKANRGTRRAFPTPPKPLRLMPHVTEDGNIGYVDFEDFYLGHHFLSPKEWELWVATEKDGKGQWDYKQVGH